MRYKFVLYKKPMVPMSLVNHELEQVNRLLEDCSAVEITSWALQKAAHPVVSTSFGPNSAVLLHMVTAQMPQIPVIWVDSGYNTNPTYKFALALIERLNLNIKIYTPKSTTAFLNVKHSGIPEIETPAHQEFTEVVKLEPFNRALNELEPDIWITGIRAEETAFRQTLNIATAPSSGIIKIAPLFKWVAADIHDYIQQHNLPVEKNYFDPTKSFEGRECGLHTRL